MMEELESMVALSESLCQELLQDLCPFFLLQLPILCIAIIKRLMDPFSYDVSPSIAEPLYREKISQEDAAELKTMLKDIEPEPEPEPESTHWYINMPELKPKPAHVKMVKCKNCLAPKPKNGTCAYCGLG